MIHVDISDTVIHTTQFDGVSCLLDNETTANRFEQSEVCKSSRCDKIHHPRMKCRRFGFGVYVLIYLTTSLGCITDVIILPESHTIW